MALVPGKGMVEVAAGRGPEPAALLFRDRLRAALGRGAPTRLARGRTGQGRVHPAAAVAPGFRDSDGLQPAIDAVAAAGERRAPPGAARSVDPRLPPRRALRRLR